MWILVIWNLCYILVRNNNETSHFLFTVLCFQISHIIREIRQFQQTAYKIDHQPKVRGFTCIILHNFSRQVTLCKYDCSLFVVKCLVWKKMKCCLCIRWQSTCWTAAERWMKRVCMRRLWGSNQKVPLKQDLSSSSACWQNVQEQYMIVYVFFICTGHSRL